MRERAKSYWFFVTRRAARDPSTMIFLVLTLCIVASAILAPWIAPTDPSESERVEWVPWATVREHITGGRITDGLSLTALLYVLATA